MINIYGINISLKSLDIAKMERLNDVKYLFTSELNARYFRKVQKASNNCEFNNVKWKTLSLSLLRK